MSHESLWIYSPKMTLTQFSTINFPKIHDHKPRKNVWTFFPEMTLTHFPKSDFLNLSWIFFPRMTLTHFPTFVFFFQNSRIGVEPILKSALDAFSVFLVETSLSKSRDESSHWTIKT